MGSNSVENYQSRADVLSGGFSKELLVRMGIHIMDSDAASKPGGVQNGEQDQEALDNRLQAALNRQAAALGRKKELDIELANLRRQEDNGAIDAIRKQLKL